MTNTNLDSVKCAHTPLPIISKQIAQHFMTVYTPATETHYKNHLHIPTITKSPNRDFPKSLYKKAFKKAKRYSTLDPDGLPNTVFMVFCKITTTLVKKLWHGLQTSLVPNCINNSILIPLTPLQALLVATVYQAIWYAKTIVLSTKFTPHPSTLAANKTQLDNKSRAKGCRKKRTQL